MKIKILSILFLVLTIGELQAASGIFDSYSILKIGNRTEYYDLGGITGNTDFNGATVYTNTLTPVYLGGQAKSYKNNGSDVTGHKINYRIYPSGAASGAFTAINYSFQINNVGSVSGDQQWGTDIQGLNATNGITQVIAAGGLAAGTYIIEVYHEITTNGTNAASNIYDNNSGNNYKLTLVIMDPPGNSLHFDGTNDYVNCNNSASLQLSSGTVECWFKATSIVSGYSSIVVKHGAYGIFLVNGVPSFYNWNTGQTFSANSAISTNTLHHIALVFSSGTSNGCSLFLDGELVVKNTITITTQSDNLSIGSDGSSSPIQFFAGEIDEVRIWNTMRTPDELISNMYTTLVGNETGLVGYYNFDQGSPAGTNTGISTLYDLSGTGNNGTLTSMALTGATSNWVASEARIVTDTTALTYMGAGNSLTFDGTNEKITIGNILTAEYTKEAWINYDGSATTNNNLISGSSTYQHSFQVASSYSFHLSAGHNNTWDYVKDPNQLSPNVWHHVAVSYSSTGDMKLYADGILVDEASSVPAISGSIPSLVQIGAFGVNAYFTGQIDEVRIWSDVRTEEEIKENMFRRLAGDEANLVAYYTFDASSGTTLTDKTSNGHNGTLVNMEDADWTDATARNAAKAITADGNWNTASTWLNGSVPNAATTDVQLLSNITLDTDISVRMLHVTSGDTLTISNTNTLTAAGNVLNDGVVTIEHSGALVQGTSSGLANGGTFNVNKTATSTFLAYNFFGSPVTSGSIDTLGGNTYYFNPSAAVGGAASSGWVAASGTMTPGVGYAATGSGAITFSGTVNNDTITPAALIYSGSSTTPVEKVSNLIGNPYPSGLDLSAFFTLNANLEATAYLWVDDNSANASGAYTSADFATYVVTGGVGTAANGSATPTNVLPSCQGFMVVDNNGAASYSYTFTNAMRVGNSTSFFRAAPYDVAWIDVISADSSLRSQMAVGFSSNASDAFDNGYDGAKMNGSGFAVYTSLDNLPYVIQTYGDFEESKTVPFTVSTLEPGAISIELNRIQLMDDMEIYLTDVLANKTINLKREKNYKTNVVLGENSDRFYLSFVYGTENTSGIGAVAALETTVTPSQIILVNNPTEVSYTVFDLGGRMLQQSNSTAGIIDLNNYNTGVYLVHIQSPEGVKTIKFIRH